LKGNKKYSLISLLFFPIVTIAYLLIETGLGFMSFNPVSAKVVIPLFISMLIARTLKNVFEEFSWRGYLASELVALNINRYLTHLIAGIVWALWHIPYNHIFIGIEGAVTIVITLLLTIFTFYQSAQTEKHK
jgi:membrane protease YdiL (CAAX protease family)